MTTGVRSRSTTVRVSVETHDTLHRMSEEMELSIQDVIARAAEAYWRRYIIERSNEGYAALAADPDAWHKELAERAVLDGTLADGLDDAR